MKDQEHSLWPYGPRAAVVAAISILFGLLLIIVILRVAVDWPSQDSERIVLLGIFLLSLVPIVLTLVDTMIERGGVVEYRGVKLDFSKMSTPMLSGTTIPANIGLEGNPIQDSARTTVLNTLKQTINSEVVIVDLEEGQAWWETRLLVLLAGAVRRGQPAVIVFLATDGGIKKCFQGWALARDLFPLLLHSDAQYQSIYSAALAATRQWGLVEPRANKEAPAPTLFWPPTGLANDYYWMAFEPESGLPDPFLAEQMLAEKLQSELELDKPPRRISLVRLEGLFRPVLHRTEINESWPSERQLDVFFDSDTPYVAVTKNGQFESLVSRLSSVEYNGWHVNPE